MCIFELPKYNADHTFLEKFQEEGRGRDNVQFCFKFQKYQNAYYSALQIQFGVLFNKNLNERREREIEMQLFDLSSLIYCP